MDFKKRNKLLKHGVLDVEPVLGKKTVLWKHSAGSSPHWVEMMEKASQAGETWDALEKEGTFSRQRRRKREDSPHRINSMNKIQIQKQQNTKIKNQRPETIWGNVKGLRWRTYWSIVRRPEPGDEVACLAKCGSGFCRSCWRVRTLSWRPWGWVTLKDVCFWEMTLIIV